MRDNTVIMENNPFTSHLGTLTQWYPTESKGDFLLGGNIQVCTGKAAWTAVCMFSFKGSNQLQPVVNDLLPTFAIHCNLYWESYVLWLIIHGLFEKINQTIVNHQDLQLHLNFTVLLIKHFINKNKLVSSCFWLFVTCVLDINIVAMVGEQVMDYLPLVSWVVSYWPYSPSWV